jgi:uncharacterized membrane protein YgcG
MASLYPSIETWLTYINPALAQYSLGFSEFGFENVGCISGAPDEELDMAFRICNVDTPHRLLIREAQALLRNAFAAIDALVDAGDRVALAATLVRGLAGSTVIRDLAPRCRGGGGGGGGGGDGDGGGGGGGGGGASAKRKRVE